MSIGSSECVCGGFSTYIACKVLDISGCIPTLAPLTCSWISLIADRYSAIVLYAKPFITISAKNSQMSFISQITGSTDFDSHQNIQVRRLEDIVRVEFWSNADMKRSITFSEKPLF